MHAKEVRPVAREHETLVEAASQAERAQTLAFKKNPSGLVEYCTEFGDIPMRHHSRISIFPGGCVVIFSGVRNTFRIPKRAYSAKRYCRTWLGSHFRTLPVYIKRGCAALLIKMLHFFCLLYALTPEFRV